MKPLKHGALILVGLLLVLVSTGALVVLLTSLPLSGIEQALAMTTGIGLQCSLYLLALQPGKPAKGAAGVLFLVSVVASTAFMEMAWQRHEANVVQQRFTSQQDSDQVNRLKQQRRNAQRQVDIRLARAEKDINGNYTSRGLKQLDAAQPFEDKVAALDTQIAQLQQTAAGTGADRGSVQALLTGSIRGLRLSVFAVLSALIDIAALMLWSFVDLSVFIRTRVIQTEADPQQFIAQRILAGDFGQQPSQRQAIDEIKAVFDQLADKGRLAKNGQRFEIVHKG